MGAPLQTQKHRAVSPVAYHAQQFQGCQYLVLQRDKGTCHYGEKCLPPCICPRDKGTCHYGEKCVFPSRICPRYAAGSRSPIPHLCAWPLVSGSHAWIKADYVGIFLSMIDDSNKMRSIN
ncbi:hypothetical protein BRADI_2g33454v3 [Brachypodium distachyon]|uniref:Uncharacterized protein n=1 Tax=Brachypodium distachyon TaxID=15368 RepID=A0A0Q3G728_BRADI|nr:hypothetical protein BRADI_2g33454v3 [Brachypodium distachyon]